MCLGVSDEIERPDQGAERPAEGAGAATPPDTAPPAPERPASPAAGGSSGLAPRPRNPQQGPDAAVTPRRHSQPETTLGQDAREVVDKVKSNLDPRRAAANAVAAATGVKPAVDAAKDLGDYAKAEKDLADGERGTADAGGPGSSTSSTSKGSGRDAAQATGKGSGQVSGKEPAAGGLLAGMVPGKKGRGASGDGSGPGAGKAAGGAGKGPLAGVKGLAGPSQSDGSAKGDAKEAVRGAKIGGAILPGAGAAVGAAVGGALQAVKTKRGRRALVAGLVAAALAPFVMVLGVALMLSILATGTIGSIKSMDEGDAAETAQADGISMARVSMFQETANNADVPWEILAAITKVQQANPDATSPADDPDAETPKPLTKAEAAKAVKDNTAVGPFGLLAGDAVKAAKKKQVPLSVPRLTDEEYASEFVGRLLHAYLDAAAENRPRSEEVSSYALSVGTVTGEDPTEDENAGYQMRYIEGEDPSGNDLGTGKDDTDADGDGDPANDSEHLSLREVYSEALPRLPIKDAEGKAEEIFNTAMMWHLGRSQQCMTGGATNVAASGTWTNPLVGRIASKFGPRVHPITGVLKLHDGTDVSEASGTPVHAASGGTATVEPSGWAGPNMVTIDHGGGIQTIYGHMSAATVTSGATVNPGDVVGKVGSEGMSTGPHLHFMVVQNGEPIDPEPFLKAKGVVLGTTPPTSDGSGTGSQVQVGEILGIDINLDAEAGGYIGKSANGELLSLDAKQVQFAAQIAAKGKEMGVSPDGIIIAFMTVAVETKFKNYASSVYPETINDPRVYPSDAIGSDHDSVGLFQQRPQSGWGTPNQLLDPGYTAAAFFGGPQGPNGGSPQGLLDHPGWETMPKGVAAQDVQVSAHPDRYEVWEEFATGLYEKVGGATVTTNAACEETTTMGGEKVASLNILGCHHTGPNGDTHAGWPTCEKRLGPTMQKLSEEGVSIAGLQEVQRPAHALLRKQHSSEWDIFPATYSSDHQNPIVWRKSDWTLVSGETWPIPYNNGTTQHFTQVLLQDSTGKKIYFFNTHNTSNGGSYGAGARREALERQKKRIEAVLGTNVPIVFTGDFNEKNGPWCVLHPIMDSVYGKGTTSPCKAPKGTTIDQIFGANGVSFSEPVLDHTLWDRKMNDHPLVMTSLGGGSVQSAIDFAKAQVGKGYSQAQHLRLGPTHYDCSGLMYRAFQKAGIELPLTSRTQAKFGQEISADQLQPGDLIFYYSPVSHVAMYIGNGQIVHAANPRSGVEIAPRSYMQGSEVGYRRVVAGAAPAQAS